MLRCHKWFPRPDIEYPYRQCCAVCGAGANFDAAGKLVSFWTSDATDEETIRDFIAQGFERKARE